MGSVLARIFLPILAAIAFGIVGFFFLLGIPGALIFATVTAIVAVTSGVELHGDAMWPGALMTTAAMAVAIAPASWAFSILKPEWRLWRHIFAVLVVMAVVSAVVAGFLVAEAPTRPPAPDFPEPGAPAEPAPAPDVIRTGLRGWSSA